MTCLAYKNNSLDNSNSSLSNIKKALLPMFILALLEVRPMYVSEIVSILEKESGGIYTTTYPYDIVFRLTENEYMIPVKKAQKDGRRRQLYTISKEGEIYLEEMKTEYKRYMKGIDLIWDFIDKNKQDIGEIDL